MRLYHYTPTPFTLDQRVYTQVDGEMKPRGLWLSAEDDENSHWWADWCTSEDWNVERLAYKTEIVVRPEANILHLTSPEALTEFTQKFSKTMFKHVQMIDWSAVKSLHQGIIIAPYQWSRRLDLMWYYGWDCASGCIWDTSVVDIHVVFC